MEHAIKMYERAFLRTWSAAYLFLCTHEERGSDTHKEIKEKHV
jgi:hypothetical protein